MDKKAVKVLGQNAPAPYELLPRSPFIIDARTKETVLIADSLGDIRYRPVRPDGTENISVDTGLNPTVLDIANQFCVPRGIQLWPIKVQVLNYLNRDNEAIKSY